MGRVALRSRLGPSNGPSNGPSPSTLTPTLTLNLTRTLTLTPNPCPPSLRPDAAGGLVQARRHLHVVADVYAHAGDNGDRDAREDFSQATAAAVIVRTSVRGVACDHGGLPNVNLCFSSPNGRILGFRGGPLHMGAQTADLTFQAPQGGSYTLGNVTHYNVPNIRMLPHRTS